MNKPKVCVTGGAGFIGSHIVDYLTMLDYDVIVYDNLITGSTKNIVHHIGKIDFYQNDVRNLDVLIEILKGVDYVIHQGALVSVSESEKYPNKYYDVNVNGTINVLEASRRNNIKKVVLASSCSVYGNDCFETDEQEDKKLKPQSHYAISKYADEWWAKLYNKVYGLKTVCLRYANVYGERQSIQGEGAVIPSFISKMIKKESPIIFGDGNQVRDFIYVGDVAKANILALKSNFFENKVYNVGTGEKTSVNGLYDTIKGILGLDIIPIFAFPRKGDIEKACLDSTKIRHELNWIPRVSFQEGLRRTIEWYKK